jgi:hypothetical protein
MSHHVFPTTYEQITNAPAPMTYILTAYDSAGGSMQTVELTRKEYKKLARRVCKLRGLKPKEKTKQ